MKTFLFMLTIIAPNGQDDRYVLDYGLTESDCAALLGNYPQPAAPNATFTCEESL